MPQTAASAPAAPAFCLIAPDDECDLVMKGGVASGIVYPPVVQELHGKYRFRNIGGTSAGAIAAAIAAAAEYGRSAGGFEKLYKASTQLGSPGFLAQLFEPSPSTRPLMRIAETMMQPLSWETAAARWPSGAAKTIVQITWGVCKFFAASLWYIPVVFFAGLIFGGLSGWGGKQVILQGAQLVIPGLNIVHPSLILWFLIILWSAVCVVFWTLAFSAVYLIAMLWYRLPKNDFGICKGHNPDKAGKPLLTDWLHQTVNHIADKDINEPLTFGDLHVYQDKTGPQREIGIELKMVTCNLSQQLPYVLPFENARFLFKEREMRDLFPSEVVEYMKANGAAQDNDYKVKAPPGYYLLPDGKDLPVVVAMRMSLALPVVISAIPLYAISAVVKLDAHAETKLKESDLQRHWFSDGGTASNFPIHFFDAWLPGHPTFGVNLTYPKTSHKHATQPASAGTGQGASDAPVVRQEEFQAAQPQAADDRELKKRSVKAGLTKMNLKQAPDDSESKSDMLSSDLPVYLPSANETSLTAPEWSSLQHITDFLGGVFYTAKDYRDTLQSTLPSYRDRIVQIRFSNGEGGINLNMPPDLVGKIVANGEKAGAMLREDFQFDKHQWIRYLVLMRQLEQQAQRMRETLEQGKFDLDALLAAQRDDANKFPFAHNDCWVAEAKISMDNLQTLMKDWEKQTIFAQDPPTPEPVLRVTSEL